MKDTYTDGWKGRRERERERERERDEINNLHYHQLLLCTCSHTTVQCMVSAVVILQDMVP